MYQEEIKIHEISKTCGWFENVQKGHSLLNNAAKEKKAKNNCLLRLQYDKMWDRNLGQPIW